MGTANNQQGRGVPLGNAGNNQGGDTQPLQGKTGKDALEQISEHIVRDARGRHYWLHEVNLYANPMFLFLVMKIFFFIWAAVALFVIGLSVRGVGLAAAIENIGPPMLYVLLFLLVLITISYYLYALLMGGSYSVLFKMDTKGVSHTQLPRQFKRAQTVGMITAIAGLLTGNFGAAGAGMLSARNASMYTTFKRVHSIKPKARRQVIKLCSGLMHNQVYTAPEDFDFVLSFIREHTGKQTS